MHVIKIAFVFVFLFSFSSALPNFFSCGLKEYHCNIRKCTTLFYKDLQEDSTAANCGVRYHIAAACIRKVFNGCVKNALNQTEVAAQLDQHANEKALCTNSLLELLGNPRRFVPLLNLTCNDAYNQGAPQCGKILQMKFVANRGDTSLCSEYSKAKKCIKDLLTSQCIFSPQDVEVFDFQFDDYNPFCADNRDPGATGSDQCVDFPPDPTPTTIACNRSGVVSATQFILFLLMAMYRVLI